jgi:uncharacterized protein YaeQ
MPTAQQHTESMRDLAPYLDEWLELGIYDLPRLVWLCNQMTVDDLVSLFTHTDRLDVRDAIRQTLEKRDINVDTLPPPPSTDFTIEF